MDATIDNKAFSFLSPWANVRFNTAACCATGTSRLKNAQGAQKI